MKARFLVLAAAAAAVFLAHWPALHAGFVWDDKALLLRDPLIRSWRLIPEGLQHYLFTDAAASNFYRPLQRLTYTLEYAAFVFQPAPYHFDNICLHLLAMAAFFCFALAFLDWYGIAPAQRLVVAGLAAGAWALHPLHSAVVDYVAGRADSLAALFGFVGLCLAIRARRSTGQTAWKLNGLAGLGMLGSALSKESGLVFCALWLVWLTEEGWRNRGKVAFKQVFAPAAAAVAFVLTMSFSLRMQPEPVEVPQLSAPAPALVRPIIALRALAEYGALLVAPANLHMERDVETRPLPFDEAAMDQAAWRELETLAGLLVLGALVFWMQRVRKRDQAVFTLLLMGAISYMPVSGLFPLNATLAEHWIYVPSAFLLLAAAAQLRRVPAVSHRWVAAAALCWIALLSGRSFVRATDWTDERTFFERTIANGGDSVRMLINLGTLEMNEGHLDKADALLRRALAREPKQPFALLNLAAVALKRNDFATARPLLEAAMKNRVSEAHANEMLAVLRYKQERTIDLMRLRLASRTGAPSWTITQRYLAALDQSGRTQAAATELAGVLRTEWYRADSWRLLAFYLFKMGRPSDAVRALEEANRLDVHLKRA